MRKLLYNASFTSVLLITLIMITGCGKIKDFGDLNVNPATTASTLLTNTEYDIGNYGLNTTGGLYCQYFSETQYTENSLYSSNQSAFWSTGNTNSILNNLQKIISQSPGNNMIAVSRILKAYNFSLLTDRYGDIPYFQALPGGTPPYDKQLDIYKDLLKELREAVEQLDNSSYITGDVIYGGDPVKWKKLGNSLRMILAMRLTKRYPGPDQFAAVEFRGAFFDIINGHITTNADNFSIKYPGGAIKNPWYNLYFGRRDYAESKTMTDLMVGLADPRQAAFGGDAAGNSSSQGFPYGLSRTDATQHISSNANTLAWILTAANRTETSPMVLLSAAQVALAKAEAAERGWLSPLTTTDAEIFYNRGIELSFQQWGAGNHAAYAASTQANYLSGVGVPVIGVNVYNSIPATSNANTTTRLARIALQYYIASYPDGAAGWTNWRRTSVPDIKPTNFAVNNPKVIPVRIIYPTSEYTLNPAGVAQGIAGLSPATDAMHSRFWWNQ